MRLHARDRGRIAYLCAMVAAGFVWVAARRQQWPSLVGTLAMVAAAIVVMALLLSWILSAADVDD